MIRLLKRSSLFLFLLTLLFLDSCTQKKDYACTLAAGTVITNSDGTQYTVTETETKSCSDCTSKDVQKLKDQGYTCK